jgi:DNA-binding XRE family transcriptional regulator
MEVSMEALKIRFRLREARLATGMTQAEVADASKISRRFYVALETEKQEPRVVTAVRLARTLNTTVEKLYGHMIEGRE